MNPSFRRLNHQFKTYLTALDCRGIYTIAMRDGQILFGPESYAEDDPLASPPGTVYLHPTAAVIALFEDPREFVEGPYEDEYGTFVSAYAPVMDSGTGEPILCCRDGCGSIRLEGDHPERDLASDSAWFRYCCRIAGWRMGFMVPIIE